MVSIGGITIETPLALAPMAGVTDLAFRTVCRELSGCYTVTEMVSAKALCYGDKKTASLLALGYTEHSFAHVARAAGIGEDVQDEKISILAEPFYSPETPANPLPDVSLPSWALYAAIGGGVLFLLLLLLFALLRRRRRKKEEALAAEEAAAAMPLMAAAPIPVAEGADIMNIRTEKSMELRKDIREFADENPEIAAQMVKSWLRGGDDSNG